MIPGVVYLNSSLVGEVGSRRKLETPAMLLDAEAFDRNIATMARLSQTNGVGLRPHAKTHKCAHIARVQMENGANGIACAKSGELLALFGAGITKLMLTAPLGSPRKIERLVQAAAKGAELIVVADREDLIAAYGDAARKAGAKLSVLVDCDLGLGRSGVTTPERVVALALAIRGQSHLEYAGVQAYSGQVQHIVDFEARRAANRQANERLDAMLAALREANLEPGIISGGGTGSHLLDFQEKLFTEVQAGSYVFMDEGYLPIDFHGTGEPVFATSLYIVTTVVGHGSGGDAITDAGTKSFGIDGPPPRAFLDGREIGTIVWAGDEFGRIKTAPGISAPPVGSRVECTVPHCDPTANLHVALHVVRDDMLVAIWPVEGRGFSD